MRIKKSLLLVILTFAPTLTLASDLGSIGQTYPIIETDILEYIQTRLNIMKSNGELQRIQERFQENVTHHAERPRPVSGMTTTKEYKSWLIDPSITVPNDLRDQTGRLIAKKGTYVNPLSHISIHHPMVFINGDDAVQVKWARQIIATQRQAIKLILVNGSVAVLVKLLNQPVYFDQEGRLSNRFHIHHVPAIVSQKGLQLMVEEVMV